MTPAEPIEAKLAEAALEVVEAPAEEAAVLREVVDAVAGLAVVPGGVVPAGVVAGVVPGVVPGVVAGVVPGVVVAPAVVGEVAPPVVAGAEAPPEEEGFLPTQLVSGPPLTVKGADWATAPLLSRRVRPREVP